MLLIAIRHLLTEKDWPALWHGVGEFSVPRLPCGRSWGVLRDWTAVCSALDIHQQVATTGTIADIWKIPQNAILTILPRVGTKKKWMTYNLQENAFNFPLAGNLLQFCYELLHYGNRVEGKFERTFLISACCSASWPVGLEIGTR